MTYEQVKNLKPEDFKRLCGVRRETFNQIDIFKNKERRQNRRSRTLRVNHEAAIVQSSTALAE
jgi:hypothetical protein